MKHKLKAFSSVADGAGSRNREENLRLHNKFLLSFVKPNSSTLRQDKITLRQKWVLQSKYGQESRLGKNSPMKRSGQSALRGAHGINSHPDVQALVQKPD